MAREKIFKPEDFDKDSGTPKKNNIGRIVGVVIGILIIVGIVIFFGMKSCNKDNPNSNAVLPQGIEVAVVSNSSSVEMEGQQTEESQPTEMAIDTEMDKGTVPDEKQQSQPTSVLTSPSPSISSDIEKEALKVIHGDYGNNPNRKNALGDSYKSIQAKVNEMKREGVF